MSGPSGEGGQGPLYGEVNDETDTDEEIVEDGEKGETAGPMPTTIAS